MAIASAPAPVTFDLQAPLEIARWRPLVQWILAIPHLIVAQALGYVGQAVAFIGWFAIVFTGRLPASLAGLIVMMLRYQTRSYAYAGFLTAEYPPFDFSTEGDDPAGHPVRVSFTPATEDRNRVTTFFRLLLAIPAAIVFGVLAVVAALAYVVAFFAVLFTGRWPEGIRNYIVNVTRMGLRVESYVYLLDDTYPSMSLGQ